jgi:hypothetical protein
MRKREAAKLELHRETVRELTDNELACVDGAVNTKICPTPVIHTVPLTGCLTTVISGYTCAPTYCVN